MWSSRIIPIERIDKGIKKGRKKGRKNSTFGILAFSLT